MVAVKRGVLVFGCAVAFAAAPLVVASPAAADVPVGHEADPLRRRLHQWRRAAAQPRQFLPVPPAAWRANIVNNPNGYGTVNGIPCSAEHWGTCQAMIQNGG